MNRYFLAMALVLGSSTIGLVGCDQKAEEKTVNTKTTPGGEVKTETSTKVEKSGDAKE